MLIYEALTRRHAKSIRTAWRGYWHWPFSA